jgi:pyridinium-3,5-biscarboxylic acid mononucleotide synthase
MEASALRKLLEEVRDSHLSPDQAMHRLRHLPFEDVGLAKIDHYRPLRVGMPEVTYSAGKTPEQVAEIFVRMVERGSNVLATRANQPKFESGARTLSASRISSSLRMHRPATQWRKTGARLSSSNCAGTSDIPVAEEAAGHRRTDGQ